jgi:hypothetical protein
MRRLTLARGIAAALVLGLLGAAVVAVAGRPKPPRNIPSGALPDDCAGPLGCTSLYPEEGPGGTSLRATRAGAHPSENRCEVTLRHNRPGDGEPVCYFASIWVAPGEVFPLGTRAAKAVDCWIDPPPRWSSLTYAPGPPGFESLAPPRLENVVIAFTGDTVLDGEARAVAQLDPPFAGDPSPATVSVRVTQPSKPAAVHRGLAAGDTFAWGAHEARIVRIVEPTSPVIGWVEVTLK